MFGGNKGHRNSNGGTIAGNLTPHKVRNTLSGSFGTELIVNARTNIYRRWGKRFFDVTVASILLVSALPLMVLLIGTTMLDGGKPIFSHWRVGKGRRIFPCFKIRTMVVGGEALFNKILSENPDASAEWERDRKLRNDPRITRLGRFVRKTSLDELPQLWNVIRGEMSLVGPRPVTESEVDLYGEGAASYFSVRPGITGAWQVSGRNDASYAMRVELDKAYVDRLSFVEDVKILFLTVPAVLKATGC